MAQLGANTASARRSASLAGWPIVGWSALIVVSLSAAILAALGTGEAGIRAVTRTTAQTSLVLFLAAFTASASRRLWPSPATRWLLANRRYLGVSFAASHFVHLLSIIALVRTVPDFELTRTTLIFGGGAYVFIAAMTATSFDRSAAWIGPRAWRILHTVGAYDIWLIFAISYVPRAFMQSPAYALPAALLLAALGVRIAARPRSRRPT